MELKKLLSGFERKIVAGPENRNINKLVYDSRKVGEGDVFVCLSGVRFDGHEYIRDVCAKGAAAIVTERDIEGIEDIISDKNVTVIRTENTRKALSYMSAAFFDYPAQKLKLIGITGTKGKTTVAFMVYEAMRNAGIKAGLIGTVETIIGNKRIPSDNTTPESYLVQSYFREMVDAGLTACVMEVSSQGIMQHRIDGIMYDIGVFTNLSPDHIGDGEHKSFEEYRECKSMLFRNCRLGLFNTDDEHADYMIKNSTCRVETFGTKEDAMYRADELNLHNERGTLGISYTLSVDKTRGKYGIEGPASGAKETFGVKVNIPGAFTVYNSLTAIAVCRELNVEPDAVCSAIKDIKVKGRVEPVNISTRFSLMIDYAHNAVSLKSVLTTLKEYCPKRLVCLFGCGGNRSRDRRFEMGEISSNLADLTIATSDNPRFEKPEDILADVVEGIKRGPGKYIAICDRKEAIRYAIMNSEEGDLIVLAGKGHEDYQEICGVKHHMDERDLIREITEEMTADDKKRLSITV